MPYSGSPLSDGEYLRMKEEELERTLRHAESLRDLISSLRRFLRLDAGFEAGLSTFVDRKRPSREERVLQLLRAGPLSLEDLARTFKIQKSEMREWMDERLPSAKWIKTEDGTGYVLA